MKVALFISGDATRGVNSPGAGEGRFGWALAEMLSFYGHQVVCLAGTPASPPSWGDMAPLPNVRLLSRIDKSELYDLAINSPWDHTYNGPNWETCRTNPLRAKWHMHVQFGWGDSVADHPCHACNHGLVYPYTHGASQFHHEKNPFKTFPLPIPLYREFPKISLSSRPDILWATKDVFHNDWPIDHHVPRIGYATLRALKRLSDKQKFTLRIISTHYFEPSNSRHSKNYNVPAIVRSIPSVEMSPGLIPRNLLLDYMSRSRLNTIVSGLCGSFLESIPAGCLPLAYTGHLWASAFEERGLLLNTYTATEDQIFEVIEQLYRDEKLWAEVLEKSRDCIKDHSWEKSHEFFTNMCKELSI